MGQLPEATGRTVVSMDAYAMLMGVLAAGGARYRILDHPPEGRTREASALRGHPDSKAAKCIVARVKLSRRDACYALVVVPGDRQVDFGKLSELMGGSRASFALRETAEALTGCISGSIIPFSFNPDLCLIADQGLLRHDEVFFNAARLDRSVALSTEDYVTLARPRVEAVADRGAPADAEAGGEDAGHLADALSGGADGGAPWTI